MIFIFWALVLRIYAPQSIYRRVLCPRRKTWQTICFDASVFTAFVALIFDYPIDLPEVHRVTGIGACFVILTCSFAHATGSSRQLNTPSRESPIMRPHETGHTIGRLMNVDF